ncbi:hypothetical protein, partial [Methanosarcina mazei]|uniref:hypothetical protein n=1 Tax=Methanosarcina mazei TaxID=2209 RepID=UPI001F2C5EB8
VHFYRKKERFTCFRGYSCGAHRSAVNYTLSSYNYFLSFSDGEIGRKLMNSASYAIIYWGFMGESWGIIS